MSITEKVLFDCTLGATLMVMTLVIAGIAFRNVGVVAGDGVEGTAFSRVASKSISVFRPKKTPGYDELVWFVISVGNREEVGIK